MKHISLLENPIQEYAWGSRTAIASLLGQTVPSASPQAELWMGAHPLAPSRVAGESLREIIRRDPANLLGGRAAQRFGNELPFLLKVLAADQPLSLQAHPSAEQAARGFAHEESLGLAIDAPDRCYKDPRPKPELICALTPFDALVGFRAVETILEGLIELEIQALGPEVEALRKAPDPRGLARFFGSLLRLPAERSATVAAQARDAARRCGRGRAEFACLLRLNESHPGDAGILAALLLHRVQLEPGQALFLPAGVLHAYLGGVGIEVMANSDNVLRGGLTSKHMDVPELERALAFDPLAPQLLEAAPPAGGAPERVYVTPAEEFRLSVIRIADAAGHAVADRNGIEILLCTEGCVRLREVAGHELELARGASALVPACIGDYRIENANGAGDAVLYRAVVPA